MKGSGSARLSACALALGCFVALLLTSCRESTIAAQTGAAIVDLPAPSERQDVAETRRIEFGAGDRSHLLDGWSRDEHDRSGSGLTFVWATALEASVSLQIFAVQDLQFLIELSSFPGATPQTIAVLVNDHEVSRFTAQPIVLEYRFVVPASVLRRGMNRLTFRHSTLDRAPGRHDKRLLAAAYHSIVIGPQCLPLRAWGVAPPPRVEPIQESASSRKTLIITGPAAIRRRLEVPREGVLRYRLSLLEPDAPAIATLRIHESVESRVLVQTRLSRTLFDRSPSREVDLDLTPWRGKKVELELEVAPEPCRSSVTTVRVEWAGIYSRDDRG